MNKDSVSVSLLLELEGHISSLRGQTALDLAVEQGAKLVEIIEAYMLLHNTPHLFTT